MALSPSEVHAVMLRSGPSHYFAICLTFTSYCVIAGSRLLPAGGSKWVTVYIDNVAP